jgi:membrane protein implicated in regulation of membrane protease activity
MDLWVIWLIAGVVFAVGEMATLGFFLAPFAIGAFVATLIDLAGLGAAVSVPVFLVVSVSAFALMRPIARRHRHTPPSIRTGTDALVGQNAIVLERIANSEGVGCVRIGGEVWTARAYEDEQVIPAGDKVRVIEIRGATALVSEV